MTLIHIACIGSLQKLQSVGTTGYSSAVCRSCLPPHSPAPSASSQLAYRKLQKKVCRHCTRSKTTQLERHHRFTTHYAWSLDNMPTNQLVVSQVADWSNHQNVWFKICRNLPCNSPGAAAPSLDIPYLSCAQSFSSRLLQPSGLVDYGSLKKSI